MRKLRCWWRELEINVRAAVITAAIAVVVTMIQVASSMPVSTLTPTTAPGENRPPLISRLDVGKALLWPNEQTAMCVFATDPDGDALTYTWKAQRGHVPEGPRAESSVYYIAPDTPGDYTVTVMVSDGKGGITSQSVIVRVVMLSPTPTPTSTPAMGFTATCLPPMQTLAPTRTPVAFTATPLLPTRMPTPTLTPTSIPTPYLPLLTPTKHPLPTPLP